MKDQMVELISVAFNNKETKHEFLSNLSMFLLDEKQKEDNKNQLLIVIGEKILFSLFESEKIVINKQEYSLLPTSLTGLLNTKTKSEVYKPFFRYGFNSYTDHTQLSY